MFLSTNIAKTLIRRTPNLSINKRTLTDAFGGISSIFGGNTTDDKEKKNSSTDSETSGDYELLSTPSELDGIQLLWEIVYCNKHETVVKSCLWFLVGLHLNLVTEDKQLTRQVREELIAS